MTDNPLTWWSELTVEADGSGPGGAAYVRSGEPSGSTTIDLTTDPLELSGTFTFTLRAGEDGDLVAAFTDVQVVALVKSQATRVVLKDPRRLRVSYRLTDWPTRPEVTVTVSMHRTQADPSFGGTVVTRRADPAQEFDVDVPLLEDAHVRDLVWIRISVLV